jgi:hypothetical protein
MADGIVSATVAPVAVLGPELLTTMVYFTEFPGAADPPVVLLVADENVPPTLSVFWIDRSPFSRSPKFRPWSVKPASTATLYEAVYPDVSGVPLELTVTFDGTVVELVGDVCT